MIKRNFRNLGITLIIGLLLYYIMLPAINLTNPAFWSFGLIMLVIYYGISAVSKFSALVQRKSTRKVPNDKLIYVMIGIVILMILTNIVVSPMFDAKSYAKRITVDETGIFTEDIAEVNFNAVPLVDKDSSRKLGDRTMGQMTDLVSQFYVSDLYTQINYNNEILRVTPLEYAGLIKYFTNRKEGITGYITVNSVSGESNLIKMDKGMKYMPSAHFFENLERYLRIKYPTTIFGAESFEIDDEGSPYWIVPTIKYTGIGLRKEITGIVMLDPVTGKTTKYKADEVPAWIDHVYEPSLIIDQVNNWGEYRGGFWNSIFGQKNVINTTEGYNYLAMADDIFLYTGITSVSTDESNLGFILTNMRTKETKYYSVPGAEEYSAMASAEGLVQEKNYVSTFPLLINLNGKPTYFLSLKDNAGLVKMYAFVDIVDYQKVITSDASLGIEAAAKKYLGETPITIDEKKLVEAVIEIKTIKAAVITGTTNYFITDKDGNRYTVAITVDKNKLPFLETGSKITVSYLEENDIRTIITIK